MNRILRTTLGLVLAIASLPALATTATAAPSVPSAATATASVHHATFYGLFTKDAEGDYVTTFCTEVDSSRPGFTFPCRVEFRFNSSLATICDPPQPLRATAVGTADYYSDTLGTGVKNNTVTSGGADAVYRHVHGAVVDQLGPGMPTAMDIDIDLSEPCGGTWSQAERYPTFRGVVTYT